MIDRVCFTRPHPGHRLKQMAAAVLLLAILLLTLPQPVRASGQVIRVGYSGSGVIQEEDGSYSGYVVDYLEEIAKYTGWTFEYSYGSWNENVERMRAGELDLMGLVRYTEERGEDFLFSALPMAHDYTAIYTLLDRDIYYQDYENMGGLTVGVMENAVYGPAFERHAASLGLSCHMKYFPSDPELTEALKSGEVDMIVDDGLSPYPEFKMLDRFQLEQTYFVAGRGAQTLMEELNRAMQRVQIEQTHIEDQLAQIYYDQSQFYLTREEQEFIQSSGPILVKCSQHKPLGYVKNGEYMGVLADYLNYIGEKCGLTFRYEATDVTDLAEHARNMTQEDYIFLYAKSSYDRYDDQLLVVSDAILDSTLTYMLRQGGSLSDVKTIALSNEMVYFETLLRSQGANWEFRYYPTSVECMDALLSYKVDAVLQDSYVTSYALQKPKYGANLTENISERLTTQVCLCAAPENELLIRILNKTISSLSEEEKLTVATSATINHPYEFTLGDAIYRHATLLQLSGAFLLVIGSLILVLRRRARITKEKTVENEALQEQIQLDALTGLYNRSHFFRRARIMVDTYEDSIYIIRLNICNFKIINELYGEAKGDYLLKMIGQELMSMCQEKDFIAGRFNADRFYLCIREEDFHTLPMPKQASAPSLGMDISLTYGVYSVGEQRDIPVNIMCDRADMANSSRGKDGSEYIRYYSEEERRKMLREQEIESEMERALAERQFTIYIQPKYDLDTGSIVGGEALVRWFHPVQGMIPPGEFIGLFERNGFIKELDYYVWEECCRFLSESKTGMLPHYPLSINVSRIHFYSSGLQTKLLELLNKYQLDPTDLELEVTESVCAEDAEVIFSKCRELRALGFKIAMDDFGSGYSSLNMLKEMPLDIIKMDLRFLSGGTNAEQEENGRRILRALIELAHTLRLKVVVEGLETKEQRDFIKQIGGCSAQGYYFSRPVDRESYGNLLSQ